MSDKNKDLLIPRYEQIANYPDNTRNVGDIVEIDIKKSQEWIDSHCAFFDKFPHLFRKLQWPEGRGLSELPSYVGFGALLLKVNNWFFDNNRSIRCAIEDEIQILGYETDILYPRMFSIITPATESDYLTYQKRKDGK